MSSLVDSLLWNTWNTGLSMTYYATRLCIFRGKCRLQIATKYEIYAHSKFQIFSKIILQICRDIAQGLRFLHSSKPPILHGDMKARNVLVDLRFRAKLCDFGLSTKKKNQITGTPYWLAPEYLRGQTQYTTMCDVYSIGIILYEIYAREDPYKGNDFRDTLQKVCDRRVNKRPGIPAKCPSKIVDMMKKCWSPDPMFRPSSKDLDTMFLDMNMRDAEPLTGEEEQIQKARAEQKTGDMLYELFPKKVADQLKAGQKVEPEQHEEVTVVFSDSKSWIFQESYANNGIVSPTDDQFVSLFLV